MEFHEYGRSSFLGCAASHPLASPRVKRTLRCKICSPAVQEVSPGDWQPCKLLSLEGVLAYSHSSSVYYCPIQMYVQTKHPRSKPTVYVRPTPDMMIERGAEYVDKAGQITIPSLTSYTESTGLAAVLREMAFIFATAPPVRSRPSAAAMAGAGAASGSRAESQSRDASALRARVTEALKRDLGQWYDALGEALSKEEVVGATLREDKRAMAGKAESGAASLRKLEEHVKAVHEQTEQLDRWLAASEAGVSPAQAACSRGGCHVLHCRSNRRPGAGAHSLRRKRCAHPVILPPPALRSLGSPAGGAQMSDIDAEAAVTPAHRLHKQLLDAVVEVNTVDDVIDALQAALENDAISLDEFVKEVSHGRGAHPAHGRQHSSRLPAEGLDAPRFAGAPREPQKQQHQQGGDARFQPL